MANDRAAFRVRALERGELPAAAETLALAFDEDPLFRFLLPRARQRSRWLRWFHGMALGECSASGGAFTVEDGPRRGVLGLLPPGAWPVPRRHTAAAIPWPRALPTARLVTIGLPLLYRIGRIHPTAPHLYVYVVGVHPSLKGRGLGGALLRHALDLAGASGVSSYLETANPANLALYRRFGFEVRETLSDHRGPPLWTMEAGGAC